MPEKTVCFIVTLAKPGMVAHTSNSRTQEAERQEDGGEFKTILDYILS